VGEVVVVKEIMIILTSTGDNGMIEEVEEVHVVVDRVSLTRDPPTLMKLVSLP